jgi:hypothetical protein
MKEDRFLMGILIGITLLIVASLSVFFMRRDTQTYLLEDSPEAVVHNYIFALGQEDYESAFTYLAEEKNKPTYTEFLRDVINTRGDDVRIGEVDISGDTASVQLVFTNASGRVFFDYYEYEESALAVLQSGEWKILSMGGHYWYWNWYAEK